MKPIFELMGKNITLVGGNGDGQTTKVANQIIVALTIEAVGEALLFASKAGADPARVRQALMGGFAASRILEVHGERMVKRNFDPGFRIELHQKDLNLALQGARALGVSAAEHRDLPGTVQRLRRRMAARRGTIRRMVRALEACADHEIGAKARPEERRRSGQRGSTRWMRAQLLRDMFDAAIAAAVARAMRARQPAAAAARAARSSSAPARPPPRWPPRSRRIGRAKAALGPRRDPLRPRRRRCERIEVVEAAPSRARRRRRRRRRGAFSISSPALAADDLVLCLISGGGSALLSLPAPGHHARRQTGDQSRAAEERRGDIAR